MIKNTISSHLLLISTFTKTCCQLLPKLLLPILCPAFIVSCNEGGDAESPQAYSYTVPALTGDGWQVGHLQDVGIDTNLLIEAMNTIRQGEPGFELIDSIVIAKDGVLVFDELTRTGFNLYDGLVGNTSLQIHSLHSVTKSWTSTAVGVAIDQGFIPNVDALVHDYFVDKMPIQNYTAEKQGIKLQDWLTMRPGYDWNENDVSLLDRNNIVYPFNESADPVQFLLDRPMVFAPGTTFDYNSGVSHVLGELVGRAVGQDVVGFMDVNLFQPLQIHNYQYFSLTGQFAAGGADGGLFISTRDMAKLGQLFLDNGFWNGQQLVSQSWINMATQAQIEFDTGRDGYGYQWWTHDFDHQSGLVRGYRADGWGGQHIIVIPALNLVVALTGHAYTDEQIQDRNRVRIVQDYILPSIN
jgi:CubicO group peptidase (beta-lactamase class C family)